MDIRKYDFSTIEKAIEAIKEECKQQGLTMKEQIAYVLATIQWETGGTFHPVKEAYWKTEEWRKSNLQYYPWYGRGHVQITWEPNYLYYKNLTGIDFISNPDLMLVPENSLFCSLHGFIHGIFTGKKITDFINEKQIDLTGSRACINGNDHADEIKNIAINYLKTL